MPTVNGILSSTDGDITFMGRVMASLPLQPPMSKLIYLGYIFNILNEAIIMGNYVMFYYYFGIKCVNLGSCKLKPN